ncbi:MULTISPECIES: NAD(P)-dependent alcohol dehydrogenase [unclassified Yoonia]|uniref:NAD(P)-dependent alcohol dehydrogenase n=1 Tax=unclassified Yoonia TaxID=2629118 RepID=UPI002AFE3E51|nr:MULTISPECIES: NAD(P)-dependent alcohol dehydrogenase [unclassified Yoonia]
MCENCITGQGPHLSGDLTRRALLAGMTASGAIVAGGAGFGSAAQAQEAAGLDAGPFPARGLAWSAQGQAPQVMAFDRRTLNPDDVLIDILYCGICHTDIHFANNDFGFTNWPLMPGHEIVGRVAAVGAAVTRFKVGDAAGVGCMVNSCGECEFCLAGTEQYCARGNTQTYGLHRPTGENVLGGYSNRIVVREAFTLRIPDGMDLARTAPLLCAGVTTFSPMEQWQVGAGDRVAVVGLGGLGHVAVKLAVARGAEVTVMTTSETKRADALAMGAADVMVWPDPEAVAARFGSFHSILSTVPVGFDPNPFLMMLRTDGVLINVGLFTPFTEQPNNIVLAAGRKSVTASLIGSLSETQAMLDYCAERNIQADIEMVSADEVQTAMARVKNKDVRYRFVIDMTTLA